MPPECHRSFKIMVIFGHASVPILSICQCHLVISGGSTDITPVNLFDSDNDYFIDTLYRYISQFTIVSKTNFTTQ